MKNNRLRILVALMSFCLLCTTNIDAKAPASSSKKKVTKTSAKPNKTVVKKPAAQSVANTNKANNKPLVESSIPQKNDVEPAKNAIKEADNKEITSNNDTPKEDINNNLSTENTNVEASVNEGVPADSLNDIPQEKKENDGSKDFDLDTTQKQIKNKKSLDKKIDNAEEPIKTKSQNKVAKEEKNNNYIEPLLFNFLNENGISIDKVCSLQDILCVVILVNLFLTFILLISISRTRKALSKSIDELSKIVNDNNQNQELNEKIASIEGNIQNNIAKIEQTDSNIQNKLETTENSIKETEQHLKSEFEGKIIELGDNVNNKINDLENSNNGLIEKIQSIEEMQNNIKSNIESFAIYEERIQILEKFIEQYRKNKNINAFAEDLIKLKDKIKNFQGKVANHLLKEHPECKWWIRFAEPNKLFPEDLANKIIGIIDDLQNKEKLNSFNEFFSLYRNFCKTRNKCGELFNRVSKGEIVFSNTYTVDDFKNEINQYKDELDQFNTLIEITPAIELDDNGKNLLSEERDKIVNLVTQESQEIDSNIANLLSIEVSKTEKEAERYDQNVDTISVETTDDSLSKGSEESESIPDFNDLFAGEETSVVVNID